MSCLMVERCGEILFENPDQNAKCVCMLGKKASHFKYIKHVDVMWSYHSVAFLAVSHSVLKRLIGSFVVMQTAITHLYV